MRQLLPVVLTAVALSCSPSRQAAPAVDATARRPAVARPLGPVITRLVQRWQVIVVRAGDDGPTYAIESRAGVVLVPPATLGDLARTDPPAARTIRELQAAVLWAGRGTGE